MSMSRMMSMLKNSDCTEDFGMFIRDQKFQDSTDQGKELGILRSGSTPPKMEGAASSIHSKNGGNGESLSEAELKADATHANFRSRNSSMNSRLPPPLMSKGDWTFNRGLQGRNENTNMSICSSQTELGGEEDDNVGGKEWKGESLMGLRSQGTVSEITQDSINPGSGITRHPSCPPSGYPFLDETKTSKYQYANLHHDSESVDALLISATTKRGMPSYQNVGSPVYCASGSAFSCPMSRSRTPDPALSSLIHRHQNPLAGRGWPACMDERNIFPNTSRVVTKGLSNSEDLLASLSGMNLSTNSTDGINQSQLRIQHVTFDHNFENFDQNLCLTGLECDSFYNSCAPSAKGLNISRGNGAEMGLNGSFLAPGQAEFGKPLNCQCGPFRPVPSRVGSPWDSSAKQPNSPVANFSLNGYEMNPPSPPMMGSVLENGNFPPFFQGVAPASAFGGSRLDAEGLAGGLRTDLMASAAELRALNELRRHETVHASHASFPGSLYLDHPKFNEVASAKLAAHSNPGFDRDYGCNNSQLDILGLQRAYLEGLLAHRKLQHLAPYPGKLNCTSRNHCGDHALDFDLSYPISPLASPHFPSSPIGPGSPMQHRDRDMHFSSSLRKYAAANGIWHPDTALNMEERLGLSLLDEFKSNKMRCLELFEIASHVVEFSADQYGSRFIQQKLETARVEEKDMVFNEIMPHALALMTDVFGNYVIQKFLEHGSRAQISELADKLTGHVLALSLHMYGCRVIQKAIEVVELDHKTSMVKELEGHVMRCVRDQNGNHVIQKCIECVPEDSIQFIISTFYGHVVTLSTHPYGCRVIQRILEHCQDPKTQQIVMDAILQSVCMLAQDQYGNYVVQHVLAHGKPEERSVIIEEFTGQIVIMSQQKFASNVIEKCLTYGTPEECQTLVDEMLGLTEDNEPLQVMMKDQFANYVVQKVLETCDDQQLELILNRIKVHLNALKKYTYGKHIVARVEKLVAAGEKRISSILAAQPALMA